MTEWESNIIDRLADMQDGSFVHDLYDLKNLIKQEIKQFAEELKKEKYSILELGCRPFEKTIIEDLLKRRGIT